MKIRIDWFQEELKILQCDYMLTAPEKCADCKHRFYCFTNRITPKPEITVSKEKKLQDLLNDLKELTDVKELTDD